MSSQQNVEIAVIGAGIAGIATAYYLCVVHGKRKVVLIDDQAPMSYTSAWSGENYRNWWPHPTMVQFTNYSIDLMEDLARESSNVFNMTRRGYVLATRNSNIDDLIDDLHSGYDEHGPDQIRLHTPGTDSHYDAPVLPGWETAPRGVDVISDTKLVRKTFPCLSNEIRNVIHIRRAGDIDSQQLARYMLAKISQTGGSRLTGRVTAIEKSAKYALDIKTKSEPLQINAEIVVNAAGPFAQHVGQMLGENLQLQNIFQQKIIFDDSRNVVPRALPFSTDLDDLALDWSDEEKSLLQDPEIAWLTRTMPGGLLCRPEGGDRGNRVKLGWAYNRKPGEPHYDYVNDPYYNPQYPEIVMRRAAQLIPGIKDYLNTMPVNMTHYGGYYTMTEENWPLIGPLNNDGSFIVGALSGFGTMAACAAGSLCALWISGKTLPDYARDLSIARFKNESLMNAIRETSNKGIL